ncbi:hypothetical protein IWW34DRAFT_759055, partial [Fusarium oxysporum f. sp. albedinis]
MVLRDKANASHWAGLHHDTVGGCLFARTVPKYIADKCGRSSVMAVLAAFSEVVILALWLPTSLSPCSSAPARELEPNLPLCILRLSLPLLLRNLSSRWVLPCR